MRYRNILFGVILILGLIIGGQIYSTIINQEVVGTISAIKYQGQVQFTDKGLNKEIARLTPTHGELETMSWWYQLTLSSNKGCKQYLFNNTGLLYDMEAMVFYISTPLLKEVLDKNLAVLAQANPYGVLMTWEDVREIFPRMAIATVRDLETGLTFHVQRRAGSAHADVQPLKAEDTKILKEIYNGKWSWKRRAVIVEKEGYRIAGSMHGMPHGRGAIAGNNFSGHFCIHFLDSTTHSNNLDLAHQLMVYKAAGLVEDYLAKQDASKMVEIALTAIGQNDHKLLILSCTLGEQLAKILDYMPKITGLKINGIEPGDSPDRYKVKVEWYEHGSGKNLKQDFSVQVIKNGYRYLVNMEDILNGLFREKDK